MRSRLAPGHPGMGIAISSVAVAVVLAGCAPSTGQEGGGGEVIEYRVATIEGVGTPMNDAFERFIDEVEECSNGRLVGSNFPAGQLGGFIDLIDGNRQGTYEITSGGFDVEGPGAPIVSALSLGYVFEDEEHVERVIEEMQDEMSELLEESTGVTILGMGEDGWRWTFASRPVENIDDLEGLKIRVPEAEIPLGLWNALGANATPVPFTEIYNALETGVIEAGEGAVAQIEANAFWEPAPHLTNTKHWFNIKPIRANADWFNSLDEELQNCLTEVGERVFAEARQMSREQEQATLEELEAQGATVIPEPTDLDEWEARAQTYNEEYFAKYPGSKEFIEQVKSLATSD
ncbi:TRAP-type C4-dicarboxylate transport system substrate-binding protein [Arthrobacter pigmenti]|uniref:TRAP-type C4-dicarboxylate transport system substrate-binding protein n=1 Tax=Arthrobacter pigmenti TaxID=271432 RepID=A0A846RKJ0_9MICC|nr:TRAP transporter substrate-binding protein [Arthrobacter pigmenti]NJC21649.1 TRAP-type C4-dicarboxylate transport system substrate-binding protein [Arthrobacter pigmenti]